MRQQLRNLTGPLRRQTRQHIFEIGIRVMPVVARRLDQTHDRSRTFTTAQRPGEEPVLAPQRPRPYLVLTPIIVNGYSPVIEVARQRGPAFQAVIQGFADGRTVVHDIALGNHPGMQRIHHRYRFLAVFGDVNPAPGV